MLSERFKVILETRPPIPGGYGQFCNLAWEHRDALLAAVELAEAVDAAEAGGWLDLSRGSTLRCDGALSAFRSATAEGRGEGV